MNLLSPTTTIFIFCASIIGFSHTSWAFGKVGHQAVAYIAEQNLSKSAKTKVTDLLGDMSMLDAAVWPDTIKRTKGWTHTGVYHFADTEEGQTYLELIDGDKAPRGGDIVRALVKAEDVLRDDNSSDVQKRYALSFMIHFVGDLHQPLHEGHPEDKGGNSIDATYFGVKTNLHAIWDTEMIAHFLVAAKSAAMKTFGLEALLPTTLSKRKPTEQDVSDFVDLLRAPGANEIAAWQSSYLLDWSADTIELREDIYKDWKGRSDTYQKKYGPYVQEKVLMAGYRLAAWLNAIMSGKSFEDDKAQQLRQVFAEKFGKNDDGSIALEPQSSTNSDPSADVDDDVDDDTLVFNTTSL